MNFGKFEYELPIHNIPNGCSFSKPFTINCEIFGIIYEFIQMISNERTNNGNRSVLFIVFHLLKLVH